MNKLLSRLWCVWLWILHIMFVLVLIAGLGAFLQFKIGLPIDENNATTLVFQDEQTWKDTAQALAAVLGNPTHTLNTTWVHRYLFADDTSDDLLVLPPPPQAPYIPVALKQVTLRWWDFRNPAQLAQTMAKLLEKKGHATTVIAQPDPAFPENDVVLLLCDSWERGGIGWGVVFRKAAFHIAFHGIVPTTFEKW